MTADAHLVERWRSLLTSYNQVAGQLERALQDGYGLTLSEFEALDRLVSAGCEQCRMQDLAGQMYLSQSALSRTVARLERAGLVERALCEADRRGVFVTPTQEGVRRHAEAHRTYVRVLGEHLDHVPA
ncbi:MarR family winged helix-turn-helix transcriptional regulator [Plantactinospora sp. KBS50]|uniref:MarR family winged helix-turn-helix transcriptional regulator n=1 Tax=Plantactinospora sp. KBS50 TaxID=2024580 RepID=UPI000BAB0061|nr:MarR family transcriptional regulator [Plantactinospora sp. KBS50]ASW54924.1 MarR family transcriptional regulator [Plantactinospora sp. KBS50]